MQIPPAIGSQKDIRLYDPPVPADFNAERYVSDTLVARGVSQVREVWQLEWGNPFAGMQGATTVKVARHEPAGAASSSNPAEGKVDVVGAASAASSRNPAEGKVEDPGAGRWRAHQEHWLQNVMLCRFELRNQCRKGSQCNYAHSLQELRKPKWPTVETDWPTRPAVKDMFAAYAIREHAAGLALPIALQDVVRIENGQVMWVRKLSNVAPGPATGGQRAKQAELKEDAASKEAAEEEDVPERKEALEPSKSDHEESEHTQTLDTSKDFDQQGVPTPGLGVSAAAAWLEPKRPP